MISSVRARALAGFKTFFWCLGVLTVAYALILAFPQPMFKYRAAYGNYDVWSDRPIPNEIRTVLDDATRRWRTSKLYDQRTKARLFFCNDIWRLWLYGPFDTRVGATAHAWFTRNIFIRPADIRSNRIYSPGPGPLADAAQRPLSYYIAHEITHDDEARKFGRVTMLRAPQWLLEGYADYVGKAGNFDVDENRAQFIAGARELSFAKSGLYREFHLKVAYLLDKKGWTLEQIFAHPPNERELNAALIAPVSR